MNEKIAVFLKTENEEIAVQESLIRKVNELLLTLGVEYSGSGNIYVPIDSANRDHIVCTAIDTLENTPWLKGLLDHVSIIHRPNVCSMRQIQLDNVTRPTITKLRYYESYYRTKHTLAQGIIVDENLQLRDGYTSYILARKYGIRPAIFEALSSQPLQKVVRGQHVSFSPEGWTVKCNKIYSWNYSLKKPVVPGDILKVEARKRQEFIRVTMIDYVTGVEFCEKYASVIKHTGKRFS